MPRCKQKIHPNFVGNKKVALFDLDETIVHCIGEINMNNVESFSMECDAKIKVQLPAGRRVATIGINIRPHWEEALKKIKDKYHIIAFTASHDSYADSVLNFLDPKNKYFEYRLYRKNCVLCDINEMKFYVKDLKIIEDAYDLKDVVVIDNSVLSFAYHLDNGIPISPFYDSKTDTELLDIADFLVKYADENDIRDKLKEVYKLNQFLEILKDYSSEESEESSESLGEEENKGDNTAKNCSINKNRTNINLNKPLLVNNINININTNKIDDKNEHNFDRTSNKNISQINLKLKEITKLFNENDDDNDNENKEVKSDKQLHTPKLNCIQKENKVIHKRVVSPEKEYSRNKKKDKQRTLRFGINFKKEWDDKQKELKNK
jgi:Dullard-like phosphatase family protein